MQLLERDTVLDSLAEYAAAAADGDPRLVLVAGEAGVGKTSLLEEFRSRLVGARWLWGACDGSFTPPALAPLWEIAHEAGGELAEAWHDDAGCHHLYRLLLRALSEADGLTVLVIEDVHWADEATLDLLQFLGPRLRDARALVLVTYRDDGLRPDHRLRVTLGDLASHRATRRIGLAPLSREAVGVLAAESGVPLGRLFDLTGGNPFLVAEVLEVGGAEVPASARDAVLARVARLSPEARRALEAAAMIGMRVEVDVLRRVADAVPEAIDECLTAGALRSEAAVFHFRHEIARLAVMDAVPAHRATDLHRRILEALLAAGVADDARLAHHAEAAGDRGRTLQHAVAAAHQAVRRAAHREAAAQYERALRWAAAEEPRFRAELYDALASEDALIDRWGESADARQAALALWQQIGDQVRVGDGYRRLSRAWWRLCRGDAVRATAATALTTLEALPPTEELGWAYANLALVRMEENDPEAITLARKAQRLATEFGARALLSDALNTEGCAQGLQGGDGVPLLHRALDVARDAGLEEQAGRAYANVVAHLDGAHRFDDALREFAEGIAYADDHDIGTFSACLRGSYAHVLEKLGRWTEAESVCAQIVDPHHLSPVNRLGPLLTLGRIRARRGHPDATAIMDEARVLAQGNADPRYVVEAGVSVVEAAWLHGHGAEAARRLTSLLDDVSRCDPWTRGAVATWARRCRVGDARVDDAAHDLPPAYALQLAGEWRAAADAWLELGCPYDAALALLDSGDDEALHEALRIFDSLGATAAMTVTQATMRRAGVKAIPRGRRAATRSDRFGLTPREQEVLVLITEGMTNADIAARLFIAEKTVDHHVSSVLAKMEVASRREAARKAAESGLVDAAAV